MLKGDLKKMKKFFTLLSSALLTGALLVGCGASDNNDGNNASPANDNNVENNAAGDSDFNVKVITDVGGVDDKSFNQSAWEGLQQFGEDFGVEVDYVQSEDPSDYAPNLTREARAGTSLTIATGFLFYDDIKEVSLQNPDSRFAIVDTVVTDDDGNTIPNLANITFAEHEGSFLVGVVAGLQTETNHVGFIGGVESELIKKFENGFKAGVKAVNPDAEITVRYAETFNDASVGQSYANSIYGNGADIIYHAAGGTGNGLFNEAINRARNGENVWAIGVDRDQHEEGEWDGGNVTLTSMVKRVDIAVYDLAEKTMQGNFPGGEIIEYGLADNGVGIAESTDNLTEESISAVEEWKEKILNGEVQVPKSDEEYEEYLKTL